MSERYKFLENVFDDNNSLEDEYVHYRSTIESKLNSWDVPYLDWWLIFMQRKLDLQWKDISKLENKDILSESLDIIWELLKEKKVKVEKFEIEEYDKPKEVEKVMFWGKFRKKYITNWIWKKIWELDPCTYKDNEKLEEDIENWKIETLVLYKYVMKKYGQDKANRLFDILAVTRSDCYEWEIEIE